MPDLLLYLLLGVSAGLLAGLFGIGGGLVLVPALVLIWSTSHPAVPGDVLMHTAIGTSLAAIVPTAIASTWSHQRHGAVLWPVWLRLAPPIVAGAAFGAWFAAQLGGDVLRYVFAAFMLLAAVQTGFDLMPRRGTVGSLPGTATTAAAGAGIGLVSSLVGIGGGTLTTPFLMYRGVPIRNAIATAAACGLPLAVAGAVTYQFMGMMHAGGGLSADTGYVYWPAVLWVGAASVLTAPFGARLTHTLPIALLKRLLALLLAVVALRMMFPG